MAISSPKGAFKVIVYMHRMNRFTVQKIRQNYLFKQISWLEKKIAYLSQSEESLSRSDLKKLEIDQLPLLADELREFLIYSVAQSGGHFGAGLGVVELTIALHYVFNTPEDNLIWDVGHQTYPHKI